MKALDLTASGIVRALSTIDDAVRGKAEALAAQLSRQGIESRIEARDDGRCAVIASGKDMFAREFGGLSRQAEAPVERAIEAIKVRAHE